MVVAGAGHNSLITAAYAAAAGLEVEVLEAREVIGGNTVTEELTLPGFHHDSCSSAHVLIQSNPLLRRNELHLDRFGLRYAFTDPAVVFMLGDGGDLVMSRDRAATHAEIARFSRRDAQAYDDLLDRWQTLRRVHSRLNDLPPAPFEPRDAAERAYARLLEASARDVVLERFEHDHVRTMMLWLSFATIQDVRAPGTGVQPYSVTAGRQSFGWALPLGGSGRLPDALARLITAHGGRVLAGAPVTGIEVHGGRAVGVVTADGVLHPTRRAVVSTIHVARLPALLPTGTLPQAFVNGVTTWDGGLTLFAVHVALARVPAFATRRGPVPAVAGALGSWQGLLAQIEAHAAGRTYPDDPWILVVNPGVVDPSRAPDGRATLKLLTIAPRDLTGTTWDRERDRFAAALIERVSAPLGLRDGDILAVRAECPLDLEQRNPHNLFGSCHGGAPGRTRLERPVPGWSGYRMPVHGLYQTGATTHPGGSVSGRPGRNAARVLLSDLGIDPGPLMGPEPTAVTA